MIWTYNVDGAIWELRMDDRLIYTTGSNRKPTDRETTALLTRLCRFYPWLGVSA